MEKERRRKIVENHPLLYPNGMVFECGDGWLHIIEKLSKEIEFFIKNDMEKFPNCKFTPECQQVKEKYGTLRFYMNCANNFIYNIIDRAEQESSVTCEICGKPGKTIERNWYVTRCDKHEDQEDYN